MALSAPAARAARKKRDKADTAALQACKSKECKDAVIAQRCAFAGLFGSAAFQACQRDATVKLGGDVATPSKDN